MDALIKKQKALKADIVTFEKNYKKTSKTRHTTGYLMGRMEGIEKTWASYRANHLEILELATKDDEKKDYFLEGEYEIVEEMYYNLKGEFADALESINIANNVTTPVAVAPHNDLKLPRIDIPKFNGCYLTWNSFKDLFTSLVHKNSALSDVQKLHYLKCNIKGEAEQIIRHLHITEANYQVAWQALLDRYENKRILVDAQLSLLISQPTINKEHSQQLKRLLDTTAECVHSLKGLGLKTEGWDPIIVFLTVKKLPSETYRLWESKHENSRELQTFKQLKEFLEGRCHTLERTSEQQRSVLRETPKQAPHIHHRTAKTFHTTTSISCVVCKKAHSIRQCPNYLRLSPQGRYELAKTKGLCLNCLSQRHKTGNCASKSKCYICGRTHHTSLHMTKAPEKGEPSPHEPNTSQTANLNLTGTNSTSADVRTFHSSKSLCKSILLATALVKIRSANGITYFFRALIDQGSQASFISEDAAQKLRLKRQSVIASITGLNSSQEMRSRGLVELGIISHTEECSLKAQLLIIPSITKMLPPYTIPKQNWSYLEGIPLADPTYWKPGKVDLLLGADIYAEILLDGIIKGPIGCPIAQKTSLGWILSGPSFTDKRERGIISLHGCCELDLNLKRFWETEEVQCDKLLTQEEQKCEEIFKTSFSRDPKIGRYIVKLPFRDSSGQPTLLGKSRSQALKRFLWLENKLQKNSEMRKEYSNCMQEYLDLGHMELVTSSEADHRVETGDNEIHYTCCYLPHHGVVKESSTTTKLRVVFDASCKTTSGIALNDELLSGPTIQEDLLQILLRWRTHKVAVTADIAKMYRQIRVKDTDSQFQRILWRFHPTEDVKDYKLLTVTFGTSSAPFLATRTLQQLATDEARKFPIASKVTLRDFYVDDLMTGADSIEDCIELQGQLIGLVEAGGFQLRKWTSNYKQLLQNVPANAIEHNLPLSIEIDATVKTLGVSWNPINDCFHFRVCLPPLHCPPSKRRILSDIAHLFDPLGWIAPILIKAKLLMQTLWLKGLGWDETVPEDIASAWAKYREELRRLETIEVPRWLNTSKGSICELHGFCDASQRAYAAALYVKVTGDQTSHTNLLIAKTKVAPLKEISLPRLELCGAVLLTRLINKVYKSLDLNISSIHAWTDSTIVLSWIRGHPNRWKSFVANRVTEITSSLNPNLWHHVPTEQNPVDCATRGMNPEQLATDQLWWKGPSWLRDSPNAWPPAYDADIPQTDKEKKKIKTFHAGHNEEFTLMNRYSSLNKLIRVTAHCQRFYNNSRRPADKRENNWLKPYEIQNALYALLKIAQRNDFANEIQHLQNNLPLDPKSRLLSLNPFLDKAGLLRVGGRLKESNLPYDEKHPIILSSNSNFTKLIIEHAHKTTLHGGTQLMLAYLRRKYWILNARNTLRHHVHKCLRCYRENAKPGMQLMGDLPQPRVQATRPFYHVGVDYAGPFDIRACKGRGNRSYKGYISLFICLATKGIHLETVSDMTTNAFLAAFRRFTARRGLPGHIYSDCGTNFIGANTQLRKDFRNANRDEREIAELLSNDGIEWHFTPPASPHFGGLWEAGVKSVKHHLKRILHNTSLTFEEFATILCQIEACLNSRPLCPISNDPTDLNILTPGHFLMGGAPLTPPEPVLLDYKTHQLNRWHLLQKLYQDFWNKWSHEYLVRLQQRPKWATKHANIRKDELVLIKDERLPPCKWLLGRILEIHPRRDGLVRVATVKTAKSILKRPITKLCLLPTTQGEGDACKPTSQVINSTSNQENTTSADTLRYKSNNKTQ